MKISDIIPYDAFPSILKNEITQVNYILNLQSIYSFKKFFEVSIDNEIVRIPYRTYIIEANSLDKYNLSQIQKMVISCFFTRHHNGYVRERNLRKIILCNEHWVVPYVLELIGEYVIEILNVIYENIEKLDTDLYRNFILRNKYQCTLIRQRVFSYWNCYYRSEYPIVTNYVGYKILRHLNLLR